MAAWNCDHVLMQMLLEAGADVRAMDINGCAPIQYVLKVTGVRPMAIPEVCFQLLLNYNAARIYPPQFHKVPKCAVFMSLSFLCFMILCQQVVKWKGGNTCFSHRSQKRDGLKFE